MCSYNIYVCVCVCLCVCVCVCVFVCLSVMAVLVIVFSMSFQTVIESYTFKFSYSTQCGVEIFRWVYCLTFHLLVVYWTKSLYWVCKTNCLCCTIYIFHKVQHKRYIRKNNTKGNPMTEKREEEKREREKLGQVIFVPVISCCMYTCNKWPLDVPYMVMNLSFEWYITPTPTHTHKQKYLQHLQVHTVNQSHLQCAFHLTSILSTAKLCRQ